MAVSREEYLALLSPPDLTPRQARNAIRLRLALWLWVIFVFSVAAPPLLALLLLVPWRMRRYTARINGRTQDRFRGVKQFAVDGQNGLSF